MRFWFKSAHRPRASPGLVNTRKVAVPPPCSEILQQSIVPHSLQEVVDGATDLSVKF